MPYQATNPFTQQLGPLFATHTPPEIDQALTAAASGQQAWATTSVAERVALIGKLGAALRANAAYLAALATEEMGKHINEATAEVERSAEICDYYAQHGSASLEDVLVAHRSAHVRYLPLGVVLVVMPWNFPYRQVIRAIVPTLLAGNAVVLKHADTIPACAHALEQTFVQAGFPARVFTNLRLSHEAIEQVLAHLAVAGLALTGSERAGRAVGMLPAKYLKKSVLELGGSDAFVVLADAHIDKAAEIAVASRMLNTGQSCIAAKRFIIEAPVYEAFATAFCNRLAALRFGNPADASVNHGPLVHVAAAAQLQQQMADSVSQGATIRLAGGHTQGAFFLPTVLENVRPGMPAYDQELFGPVASLFKAASPAHAIALANASPYGLGGTLFTADVAQGRALARGWHTGTVYINTLMKSDPALPFGGVKNSGHGRELSTYGLHSFTNVQAVAWAD